jgi:putative ABC transport system substrate-binding protein
VNSRRKLIVALGAGALAAPLLSFAQQQGKVWRVGFLGNATAAEYASRLVAMKFALRELGYIEGKNVVIEERFADHEDARLPQLAGELVRSRCDVIAAVTTPAIRALMEATPTIPIVMVSSGDAVRSGLIASLARPGGNVTGLTYLGPELYAKRVELLKELIPRLNILAHLEHPEHVAYRNSFSEAEKTAASLKIKLLTFEARNVRDFDSAFVAMAKVRANAVLIAQDSPFTTNPDMVATLAVKYRLPAVGTPELAESGGLLGYGGNALDMYRRSAIYVDKILKGAKPADLPVERPVKFDLIINMKTAMALSIKIPNSILVQATKVIE